MRLQHFSYNIANSIPITINDPSVEMNLIYIDDVVIELIEALKGNENMHDGFCYVEPIYAIKLGEISNLLYSFKSSRENRSIPSTSDAFTKKLYANYLSYLPTNDFGYDLKNECR